MKQKRHTQNYMLITKSKTKLSLISAAYKNSSFNSFCELLLQHLNELQFYQAVYNHLRSRWTSANALSTPQSILKLLLAVNPASNHFTKQQSNSRMSINLTSHLYHEQEETKLRTRHQKTVDVISTSRYLTQ